MLFLRTKRYANYSLGNPFLCCKTTLTEQLNGEKWDIELGYVSASDKAILFSCPVLGRMYNIVIITVYLLFYWFQKGAYLKNSHTFCIARLS